MKWAIAILLIMVMTSCKPEYHGDGVLTVGHGILWTPIYKIQMPQIDISKPHVEKYDLNGLPSSEAFYCAALVVPFSREITPSNREMWGSCRFTITKNGRVVQTSISELSKMINNITVKERVWLNGLYTMDTTFTVPDHQDHWELIFECAGFASPEPVWANIRLQSGGK